MTTPLANEIVWNPPQELIDGCALTALMKALALAAQREFASYEDLYGWSVAHPLLFWENAADFLSLRGAGSLNPAYENFPDAPTPLARKWFPNFHLNFAENLLATGDDEQPAIVSYSEDRLSRRYSRGELRRSVAALVHFLKSRGVGQGDRVFAHMPNIPEAIVCMLAAAALGATWSSCGTDYQFDGLRSRLERVKPTVLISARSFLWRGNTTSLDSIREECQRACETIKTVITVDYLGGASVVPGVHSYEEIVAASDVPALSFERFPFNHPLYVMFSSGTTGKPKGIVHSAGGTLLEHKKEQVLHADLRAGDLLFYHTSTSWMMWNWMVSGLAVGATLQLFDGDPMLENGMILWRMADQECVTHFGTSAAYLGAIEKMGLSPQSSLELKSLRVVLSTGSTLHPPQFDFVMKHIKPLWLQSISGGTDIIGCFGIGSPLKPVHRGTVQCRSLGYDIKVYDLDGKEVVEQEGELVCVAPAPSMPVSFLDDPSGESYRAAYFDEFPGVWRHGDFVKLTASGELVFLGRSDATLKPAGVRVATADIYNVLHQIPDIAHAVAVGYTPNGAVVEKIVLFVVLHSGVALTEGLHEIIRTTLRHANAFYVPALILQAPDVPRTSNNKLSELSLKRVLAGKEVGNLSALSNPDSIKYFLHEGLAAVKMALG
jgi:acetoacetyl-CoA synthetase